MKGLGPYHRTKRGIYTKEGESVLVIKGGKGGGADICREPVEKRVYSTFKIALDITGAFCGKKRWHAKNGTRLSTHKPVDNKKRIPPTSHCGYTGWSGKEKGVHEAGLEMGLQQCQNQRGG